MFLMSRTGGAVAMVAVMVGACSPESRGLTPGSPLLDATTEASTDAGVVPPCSSATDCKSDEICCTLITFETNCQAGPCPSLPPGNIWRGGPLQRCATAAECFTPGDTCGYYTTAVTPGDVPGIYSCNPPIDDGGTTDESSDARTSDAQAG